MIFSGKRPANLGVKEGKLAACPAKPNCVSSQSSKPKHTIAPFAFGADPAKDMARLKSLVASQSGVRVIEASDHYIYAECKTPLMGFVDDLEFAWDSEARVCHVRSASRLGYSDLGKNRSRVEAIRAAFQ